MTKTPYVIRYFYNGSLVSQTMPTEQDADAFHVWLKDAGYDVYDLNPADGSAIIGTPNNDALWTATAKAETIRRATAQLNATLDATLADNAARLAC